MRPELGRHSRVCPPFAKLATAWGSLGVILALVAGCQSRPDSASRSAPADWLEWQTKRRESLIGSNGWTTLVARHWLSEGPATAGSNPTNSLVLPTGRAPAHVGTFHRARGQVRFEAGSGVFPTVDGQPMRSVALTSDISNAPTRIVIGPLTMTVIERGERLGVRVRDPDSPARQRFQGIDCFPYDPAWRLAGRYAPFSRARVLKVQDIVGGTQELTSPGAVEFEYQGQTHRLDVVEEPGETDFFVIFRDRTAGRSTYPSGRFLYVARPAADGRVWIDFNRSYTPPCGYTEFAVCPLPPPQNWLPFAVNAGEMKPRSPGHGAHGE